MRDAHRRGNTEIWVLVATILGSSMVFIDGTTVNVALPALQASLGATVVDMQWVVNAYTLLLASLLLLGGALGDRYGRRRVFVLGVTLFSLASAACGLAPDTLTLILARAVQGAAGALLTPGSLALLYAHFPRERRGAAIGLWSGFSAITSGAGPVLGGWLIDTLSWRWVFFLNVPLAIVVVIVALARVRESRDDDADGRIDLAGAATATLGLGALVFALLESSVLGFGDPRILGAGAIGLALLALFPFVERRAPHPMVPLAMFGVRAFRGANLLTLLVYASLGGLLFFLPMNLIQVQGFSATAAGAALLPFVVLMFALSRWSGGLVARLGARRPLILGPVLVAVAFVLFALPGTGARYLTGFFPAIAALGLGMALTVAPLTTTVMDAAPAPLAGTASGINNAVSRLAGLLAITLLGLAMIAVFGSHLADRLQALPLPEGAYHALWEARTDLAALRPPAGLPAEAARQVRTAVNEAFVAGFRVISLAMAALALLGAVVAWRTIDPPAPGPRSG